jgi:hypothetical protein
MSLSDGCVQLLCEIARPQESFLEITTCFFVVIIYVAELLSYRLLLVEPGLGSFAQMGLSDGCVQLLWKHSRSQKSFLEITVCFSVMKTDFPELL